MADKDLLALKEAMETFLPLVDGMRSVLTWFELHSTAEYTAAIAQLDKPDKGQILSGANAVAFQLLQLTDRLEESLETDNG